MRRRRYLLTSSSSNYLRSHSRKSTQTLYLLQGASYGASATVKYVDFIVEPIGGTSYDANTGSFGNVGFGGGDEETSAGLMDTIGNDRNYESLSSNSYKEMDTTITITLCTKH